MLYSYNGEYPAPLPFRIKLPNGQTRTDPSTFTQEEILLAGYSRAEPPPAINEYQRLSWAGGYWLVEDLSEGEIFNLELIKRENLIKAIIVKVQNRLDSFAQTKNYDSILSACTYATSTITKFQQEGQYCVNARDLTWAKLYELLAEVESGARPMPTGYHDIESELPVLVWPSLSEEV